MCIRDRCKIDHSLIRILCGKYEQEKLPDITFELVDMTPDDDTPEAATETTPEETPEPPAEPEQNPAEAEKSEETEDTPDA